MEIIEKKQRNSSIELLRIIAMLMIIFHHMFTHGYYRNDLLKYDSLEWYLIKSFSWLGMIGNYIFILISGYFCSFTDLNRSLTNAKKIYLKYFLYSIFIGLLFFILKIPYIPNNNTTLKNLYEVNGYDTISSPMSIIGLIKCFLPFTMGINWYASTYLIFLFFIPFLNKCLKNTNKKEHIFLCGILIIIGSLIQLIPSQMAFSTNSIFQFFMLFTIGSFIKRYQEEINISSVQSFFIFLTPIILIILLQLIIYTTGNKLNIDYNLRISCSRKIASSFLTIVSAIGLFLIFLNIKNFSNKFINICGEHTFDVYLIHDNAVFSLFMWNKLLKINNEKHVFDLTTFLKPFIVLSVCLSLFFLNF